MLDLEKIQDKKPIKELIRFSIINLDKPTGPTSFQVSSHVRRILNLNKTSHFGTLDPMVSGVLPVGLGRACRLNDYFMHRNKTYVGIMRLHEEVEEKVLLESIKNFIGKIKQLPPVRSRVKRQERTREIINFKIIEFSGKDILFETEVQAGTYIRKLIHDIGLKIGGAHMLELRRTQAGFFQEKDSINLYHLDECLKELEKGNEKPLRKILFPGEGVTKILPCLEIKKEYLQKCLSGSPLFKDYLKEEKVLENEEKFALISDKAFIGCYKKVEQGKIFGIPEFIYN